MAASRSAWRPVAVSLVGGRGSRGIATLSTRGREESVTPDGLLALGLLGMAAPAVPGIAVKTKSLLTGRRGPPVFQLYADLAKLVRKGRVYSRTTTLVFRAGPVVALASLILAALFLPLDGREAPARFVGACSGGSLFERHPRDTAGGGVAARRCVAEPRGRQLVRSPPGGELARAGG